MAALGNGEALNAALGAAASQLAAGQVKEFASDVAKGMTDDPTLQQTLTNLITNIASSGIGLAAGGESGANAASLMDRYNRQLHDNEFARLRELAGDDAEKMQRLLAVACAKVQCYAEFAEGTQLYDSFKALSDIALQDGYEAEWALLANQTDFVPYLDSVMVTLGSSGTEDKLFDYTLGDSALDAIKHTNNEYQLGTRAEGLAIGLFNNAILSSYVLAAYGSGGTASALTAVGGSIAYDQSVAGYEQVLSGKPTESNLLQGLKEIGLSDEMAGYLEFALATAAGLGSVAKNATNAIKNGTNPGASSGANKGSTGAKNSLDDAWETSADKEYIDNKWNGGGNKTGLETKQTQVYINSNNELVVGRYTYSKTATNHYDTRPYMQFEMQVDEIISTGNRVPDPGGIPNAWRYEATGTVNGRMGTWELVIDDNNKIWHFLHKPTR